MQNGLLSGSNVKQAVPFFMVVNMEQSLDFYLKGLGFKLRNKWEPHGKLEWCWLQLDNASIMLQEYQIIPPTEKLGLGVSVCFICEDALGLYRQIIQRGLQPAEPFVGNNMWVVQLQDPDGYNIAFESHSDPAACARPFSLGAKPNPYSRPAINNKRQFVYKD